MLPAPNQSRKLSDCKPLKIVAFQLDDSLFSDVMLLIIGDNPFK